MKYFFFVFLFLSSNFSYAYSNSLSFQTGSFAANAGGQDSFSTRLFYQEIEYSLLVNYYFDVESFPMVALTAGKRFTLYQNNWFKPFLQFGVGFSNVGAVFETLWSLQLLWIFRFDVSTQFLLTNKRILTWEYPLWFGLSVPF